MKSGLAQALLSACVVAPAVHGLSLEKCHYRMTNMQHTEESFKLAIFDCTFDDDLYLKSRLDEDLAPIPSVASKEAAAATIASSSIVSQVPSANFAGLTLDRDSAVPNALFSYSHNVKLGCQHEGISFILHQRPDHAPPVSFLYSLPPTKNSINELWQAFGAYKWPEDPIPRRMSVGLMVDAGYLSQDDIETCIDNGKLTISADTSPLEPCYDCHFIPKGHGSGCEAHECSIWKYSDSNGNPIDPLSSVLVERSNHECSLETFTNFTSSRLPQLYELLETSRTEKESDAAMLSYTTIVNDIDYAACKDVFDSFYTTRSATIFMKGVRGCSDPSDDTDPCCNEAAQWSDCCLPEDKNIEIDGVFNSSNLDAIEDVCGANGPGVAALLDSEISSVLISASHPEFGCNAAYEKVVPKHEDQDIFKTLWEESPVSTCEEEVRWGKTITGLDTCNANEECWSQSCVSDHGSQRCTSLYGEAVADPLLRCIASRLDKKVWRHMANALGIDPSKVRKGANFEGPMWENAVDKFRRKIGSPNCVGEEAEQGICAIVDVPKETCLSINHIWDWGRQMEWVVDDTNVNGGFCKKRHSHWHEGHIHIHGHTENVQEECESIFEGMGGACTDSTMPNGLYYFKSQSECTGETESWFDFSSHAIEGHRLVSQKIWLMDEATGNWREDFLLGNQAMCELQTSCNWDPENRITLGDESLCLDPSSLESTTYPRASFEENGTPMTCLQCWGSRCEDFWSSSPPICAVSPHNHDDCAANSGGGPNGESPVTAMSSLEGHDSHMRCRRNELKAEVDCLPADFCPTARPEENTWDEWLHHCGESSCWDLSKSEDSCHYDETTGFSFGWRSEWAGGDGLCRVEYDHEEGRGFDEKSYCESMNFTWWEGRAFKPGRFNDAESCTTYCNDGSWPIKETCDTGSCNEPCAQCVESDTWRFPDGGACYLTNDISQDECYAREGYDWDWNTKLCYLKEFYGDEEDCIALDQSGSGFDSFDDFSMSMMSMSMMSMNTIFDFYEPEASQQLVLIHQYVSCAAQAEESCSAYCWAKDYDEYSDCEAAGFEWDWSLFVCKHPTWMVNQESSPTCESYVSGLNENSSGHERWQRAERCWSNGCHFEAGSVGHSAPSCEGRSRGCAQQDGNNEWVDGGDDSTSAAKIMLGCRYDLWRSCPTKETCESAGECEDWFIGWEGGKCIVPIEPNQWGHRKGCHEVTNPIDGTRYEYADKMGCVAMKSDNGETTFVKQAECSSIGGSWVVRAKSKEECEDDRGNQCVHPFDDWRVFGGITTEEKCDTCGYQTTPVTTWRSGVWSTSAETPLYWVERAFSTKNTWEEHSFDPEAFHALIRNAISRYIADAYKRKVYCELGAFNAFIPAIIGMCSAEGGEQNIVKYDLTTSKVSCGDLQDQPPLETYEGSISYNNAECTNNETFAEATIGKVVAVSQQTRRRTTSSSVCSQHEIITNANSAIIGQTLGNGLSVTNVDNATVCIRPTVPDSEICSQYVEFGIATVDEYLTYSTPLSTSTAMNTQGEICFDGSQSGVTYVPVKLMSGWEAVQGPATQAPTAPPTQAPTNSQGPTVSITQAPTTEGPTASTTQAPTNSQGPTVSITQAPTTQGPTSSSTQAPTTQGPAASSTQAPTTLNTPTGSSSHPSASPSAPLSPTNSSSISPSLSLMPSEIPTKMPTSRPTKDSVGSVEVSFEVAIKLDIGQNVTDVITVDTLDTVVDLLKKVFSSIVPPGALIRILKVAGYQVTRRLLRYLEGEDSSGVDVEFEVIMTKECNTSACDNSDEISSTIYNEVTSDLRASVEDGEMARVIREEAETEGVSALSNTTVNSDSLQVSAATVTIQEAGVDETGAPTTTPATFAPTSSSTTVGRRAVILVAVAMCLSFSFFGVL